MTPTRTWLLAAVACLSFSQCRTARPTAVPLPSSVIARITAEGFITCFDTTHTTAKLWCEASAVVAQRGRLLLANDKDIPAPHSAVFSIPLSPGDTVAPALTNSLPTYLDYPAMRTARKFEEFAQSPDGNWLFLTTAFDRIKPGSTDFDGYNTLLAWHPGQESTPQVVGADLGGSTSQNLRRQVQQALGGSPYFKIEGLAATNTDLWFGIREQGERFDKFEYRITLLRAPYRTEKTATGPERVVLGTPVLVRDIAVGDLDSTLTKPLGISSLEYDPARRCFWLLTSYEQPDNVGAYLWVLAEDDIARNTALRLVRTADGKPLAFSHKAEDMTFIGPNTLFIIHDDDRVRTRIGSRERQPNEAAYSIVNLLSK